MTQRRTSDQIQELVREYRKRGSMTRRAFCESRSISLATLDYYLRRYTEPAVRLAKVEVRPATVETAGRFTLILGNRRRIECGEGDLAQLIHTAEAM
jgi:hypothetical protein